MEQKSIYFLSDFHLGAPNEQVSKAREKEICSLLTHIQPNCKALYLVGDIFDFWFEYKRAIPKGFVRFQAKIIEFTDLEIPVYWFTGNHDMWIFDYIPEELGVEIIRHPIEIESFDQKIYIGHGDGLGPGDRKYKILKKFFNSSTCQWLFARIHPNFGIGLANRSSYRSRDSQKESDRIYLGKDKEWLFQYCQEEEAKRHHDLYIFGHRHLPLRLSIKPTATYYNLGEWLHFQTFGILNQEGFQLVQWKNQEIISFNHQKIQGDEI